MIALFMEQRKRTNLGGWPCQKRLALYAEVGETKKCELNYSCHLLTIFTVPGSLHVLPHLLLLTTLKLGAIITPFLQLKK